MINRITYSVVFPTNGMALKGEFKPQPGITAVIGPNESGKTFTTIEVTRYLLFGKRALRGPASDYKRLEVEGEVVIKGHVYTISRTAKKETIKDAIGNILAVGSDEVTNRVIDLLGYGLLVFDITNASVQKHADLFGQLKPAERKKLIDEVVGLVSQEKVERELKSEAAVLQREAEALTRQLLVPEEPVKPADYLESSKLKSSRDEMRDQYNYAQKVAGRMAPFPEPVKPHGKRVSSEALQSLVAEQAAFTANQQERQRLQTIVDNWIEPRYNLPQLEAASERLTLQGLADKQITCPKCGHDWIPGHTHVEVPDGPDLTQQEIRDEMTKLSGVHVYAAAKVQLETLPQLSDKSDKLEKARKAVSEWERYDHVFAMYDEQARINREAEKELRRLGQIPMESEIEYVSERYTQALIYEQNVSQYNLLQSRFDALSAEIAELGRRAKAFKAGVEGLSKARSSIKGYLSPAISAAASNLMHHMTKGKHSVVTVDEDMEVTVGTQSLDTLSGGAATVANLALRFALGQVLVADTFPVFFGDEMDSDADDGRRETVADALQTLVAKGLLKQVILITHRSVDIADHVRDLGITE